MVLPLCAMGAQPMPDQNSKSDSPADHDKTPDHGQQPVSSSGSAAVKAAYIQAAGAIIAALVGALLAGVLVRSNASKPVFDPDITVVTASTIVGKPVLFDVNGFGSQTPMVDIFEQGSAELVATLRLKPDGKSFVWNPEASGAFTARARIAGSDGTPIEDTTDFEILPPPVLVEPDPIAETFERRIGNNGSCTEENVQQTYELCLRPGAAIEKIDESYISVRNGQGSTRRIADKPNCVELSLSYSDSGRDFVGSCRGNGWVDYRVTLHGIDTPPAEQ